ncbi:hypothetical protein DPMN_063904 [Dreissena polymorpha]|uniref:Uncharacterized protein n=1 Tax=Dreissena polymorpha TaxID=45954 RepID=A0A9D4HJL4_DREPO|nr:hypothetical protein DPMN_063904 [Dreissena polymorpha]
MLFEYFPFHFSIGKASTLTILQDAQLGPLGTVFGMSKGTNTLMDLHPLTTKFYAGGLPADANMVTRR